MLTRAEMKDKEYNALQERKEAERNEIEEQLSTALKGENVKVISTKESGDDYALHVYFEFTIDGYTQQDSSVWSSDESLEKFVEGIKNYIGYIKELRKQYPKFCKQNDFIQTNSNFTKKLELTHMGYKREYNFSIKLADYLKLPNSTSCSFGGGDYEIKRTPKRVMEYNENIDKTINFLIDCIAELKGKKYQEEKPCRMFLF